MKNIIISYSYTGNNLALAKDLADKIKAKHFQVIEPKTRTTGKIMLDMLFNLTPKINGIDYDQINKDDLIIFIGPIWMGKISAPLRFCLKYFKNKPNKYVFITVSGGVTGRNFKISDELTKRIGRKPEKVLEFLIADIFLPKNPKSISEDTSKYHLTKNDTQKLTNIVIAEIKSFL